MKCNSEISNTKCEIDWCLYDKKKNQITRAMS